MIEKSLNVFIVDDEISIIEWMIKNIEWEVYNCKVVGYSTNAIDTLSYINEHPVDLLLTDISMPDVSGLEMIKTAKERFPELLIIVISAYDNFSYVREAFQYGIINYCLKPIDANEVQECLKTVMMTFSERKIQYYNQDRRIFRNSIFLNLLNGEISAIKLKDQKALAGIDFNVAAWQVVLMDMRAKEESEVIVLLKYYSEYEYKGYYCFLDANMNLVFILYGNAVSNESSHIQKLLNADIDTSETLLCMGEPLSTYRQIAMSYQVCNDFLSASSIFHSRVLQTGKYPYKKYLDVVKDHELQQIVKMIKTRDRVRIIEMIKGLMDRCSTEEEKKAELICLSVFLIKNMIPFLGDNNMAVVAEDIDFRGSSEKMLRELDLFFKKVININEQAGGPIHPSVKYLLKEVNTHYADATLSLKKIATSQGMSPVYLGILFKEQIGELFNDYLLKVRLEGVLELLGKSKISIGEVALSVGFTSQSYLNRVFRKKFGMSPMEYRRKIWQEKV